MISIISYVMPIIIDSNYKQLKTINVTINKIARKCLGFESYKWSNAKVLVKYKMIGVKMTLVCLSDNFVSNIISSVQVSISLNS